MNQERSRGSTLLEDGVLCRWCWRLLTNRAPFPPGYQLILCDYHTKKDEEIHRERMAARLARKQEREELAKRTVNFVLVGPVEMKKANRRRRPVLSLPTHAREDGYPVNWQLVSILIKRLMPCCERCGISSRYARMSVHHCGVPFANGRPGSTRDKHDLRRENLMVLCKPCHWLADQELRCKANTKRKKHRALGVGTGLVPWRAES